MAYISDYLSEVKRLITEVNASEVDAIAELIHNAYRNDKRLLLMGNGGSGSTASHFANDYQKGLFLAGRKPFQCLAVTDSMSLILAWGNDTEFANIFEPQIRTWAGPGDVVLGISGSGNSENVIRAMNAANELGSHTVGLCGYSGGKLKDVAKHTIWVKSNNMQQVEDIHCVLMHTIYSDVLRRVMEGK
jgi:D-sedoheptulose 7-phosphate isomerase